MRTSSHPSRGSGGGSSSNAPDPDMASVLAGFCLTLGVGGWYVVILTAFYRTVHEKKKRSYSRSTGRSPSSRSIRLICSFLIRLHFKVVCLWAWWATKLICLTFYCQSIWLSFTAFCCWNPFCLDISLCCVRWVWRMMVLKWIKWEV